MKRVLLILVFLLLVAPAQAQAAESFTVSPAVLEMSMAKTKQTLTLTNTANRVQTYTYSFEPFTITSQGKIQFIKSAPEYRKLFSQTRLTPSTIQIEPGKSANIQISIDARNLPRKDYYYAILIGPSHDEAPTDSTVTQIVPRAAVPILFSASRDAKRNVFIKSFTLPTFVFMPPVPVALVLSNNGNTYSQIYGTITVKNLAGKVVESIDLPSQYLLAGTDRKIQSSGVKNISINNTLIGLYRVSAIIQTTESSFSQTHVVVAIPPLFLVVLGVAAFMCSGIYLRVRKYR